MQFLRTVFWVVLAVIAVVFAIANQQLVEVHLSGFIWNPPLWFALLVAFLLGLLPAWAFHRATRWNLKRKLEAATRAFGTVDTPQPPLPVQPPTP
jgi:lipopolysaccharide assembly protein A